MSHRWLVTGGTGFIGRHFVRLMREAGNEVYVVTRQVNAKGEICGDVFDGVSLSRAVSATRPTHLAHFAWTTDHATFWTDPANEQWHRASMRLVRHFLASGGQGILGIGSCAEYAWDDGRPLREDVSPILPATPYGEAKSLLASDVSRACEQFGAVHIWARIFFAYGPGEHASKLIPSMVRDALSGRAVALREPERRLDFIHVHDVASALVTLAREQTTGVYNVGTGQGTSVRNVAELAGVSLKEPDQPIESAPLPDVVADAGKLRALGWQPFVRLADGIEEARALIAQDRA